MQGDSWGGAGAPLSRLELAALVARAERMGLSRRQALKLLAAGGAGAVLAACTRRPAQEPAAAPAQSLWVKDPAPFVRRATNLETRLELLDDVITPNELFFVRNHGPTTIIDADTYRLRVGGDAVERPVEMTLADLRALPQERVVAYLECAGNWRGFWQELTGRAANGGQWRTGGVGCAEWAGPTLASVLARAGVRDGAVDVDLVGLDDAAFSRPMPLERALDPTTLLALEMNGVDLPPDHGYPVRAVVPGWVGSSSVKWLGEIRVTAEKVWSRNNTTSYVLAGEAWPEDRYAPARGAPITTGVVKSALALPRPGELTAGPNVLHGFAYSADGPVRTVEWSADGGATWRAARILDPVLPHAWQRFRIDWSAPAGRHRLLTRATDAAGNRQPDTVPFNEGGYLLNVVLPHEVVVT